MEGRSEPQSLTPDPVDPVDPLDPAVNSEWRVSGMKNNENEKCHSRICNININIMIMIMIMIMININIMIMTHEETG